MRNGATQDGRQPKTSTRCLSAIDDLLIAAIKQGPAKKRQAIERVLELVPEWTRGDCWERIRYLRRVSEPAALQERQASDSTRSKTTEPVRGSTSGRWTPNDDDRLLNLAGSEPVNKIAQRLSRSVPAVRFRLGARGMSAKVTDGLSLRALRKMFRMRSSRLALLIGDGLIRVRDARIPASSLGAYCDKNRSCLDPSTLETVADALAKKNAAFTWERVAELLGVELAKVQRLISAGQLRLADTFVTDRSFEEFCKKHGDQINVALIDPAIAKWLVTEYGVSPSAAYSKTVSRAQKHALVVRACKCGKRIAGNAYFRHLRTCQFVAAASAQYPA